MPELSERFLFDLADFDVKHTTRGDWLGRMDHLSASSLGMFRRCPEQFRNRYLLKRKEPPGEAIVVGSFFHETMEWNYKKKVWAREDQPLSEMVTYLQDEAVPSVLNGAGGIDEVRWDSQDKWKSLDKARGDAQRITSTYYNRVLPRIQPTETELRLEWHIRDVPVPVIGYLDVIAEGPRVIDTKTGAKAVKKVKPGWMLQGHIYAAWSGIPVEYHSINRAENVTVNTPLEAPELLIRPNQREAANLAGVIQTMVGQIEHLMATIGPDEPWPTWGKFADWSMSTLPCNYCGFRKGCPAWA